MSKERIFHFCEKCSDWRGTEAIESINTTIWVLILWTCSKKEQFVLKVVKGYMKHVIKGKVRRYELVGLAAFNFVCTKSLGGGGLSSLHMDRQGKCYAQMLLDFPVVVPESWLSLPERNISAKLWNELCSIESSEELWFEKRWSITHTHTYTHTSFDFCQKKIDLHVYLHSASRLFCHSKPKFEG